jgi:hypothetical protein
MPFASGFVLNNPVPISFDNVDDVWWLNEIAPCSTTFYLRFFAADPTNTRNLDKESGFLFICTFNSRPKI